MTGADTTSLRAAQLRFGGAFLAANHSNNKGDRMKNNNQFVTRPTYHDFERRQRTHNRRTIDGTITGSGKCCGYCICSIHPGYLTEKQRFQHDCLARNCYSYIPKEKPVHSDLQFFNNSMQTALAAVAGL